MKATPKQYAKALYELTKEKSGEETKMVISGFVRILARDGKLNLIRDITDKYEERWNKENGIIEAQIVSAKEITGDMLGKIEKFIKEKYNANEVILKVNTDENIKGGVIIRVGNDVLDASISKKLENLKKKITN